MISLGKSNKLEAVGISQLSPVTLKMSKPAFLNLYLNRFYHSVLLVESRVESRVFTAKVK